MRTRLNLVWVFLSALPAAASETVKLTDYFPPPESKGGWRILLPEKGPPDAAQKAKIGEVAGVDWDKLDEAWKHNLRAEGPTMLLVIRRGYLIGEWYNAEWMEKWGRHKAPGFYSTTKAYISTAFGLLLDDSEKGKLSGGRKLTLDTKVCNKEWLPESLPLSDPRKADITLWHLLFATSGIPREGLKIPPEVLAKAKGPFEMALGHVEGSPWAKLTGEPGTMFNYSSPGVLHLILLFNNAAKMDLLPYIKERVCDPIGMEDVGWGKTGGKGFIGPYCSPGAFNCSGRDHARFLHLAMHRGNWAGKQIVPASYYDAPRDFVQTFGQRHNSGCLVPSLDLVFVRIGDGPYPYSWGFEKELVKRVLAARLQETDFSIITGCASR